MTKYYMDRIWRILLSLKILVDGMGLPAHLTRKMNEKFSLIANGNNNCIVKLRIPLRFSSPVLQQSHFIDIFMRLYLKIIDDPTFSQPMSNL